MPSSRAAADISERAARRVSRARARPLSQDAIERQVWRAFFDALRMTMPLACGRVRIVTGETFANVALEQRRSPAPIPPR